MQKLSIEKRAMLLKCLIEGTSIRATERITGTTKKAILKFLPRAAEALDAYSDGKMRNLHCPELQLDEVWSFVGCKENAKVKAKGQHPGDVWTWTALCAHTKLIPAWRVGDRSMRTGYGFCADLAERVSGDCQITSDGHPVYRTAIASHFPQADIAMLIKIYGKDETGKDVVIGTKKETIQGTPNEAAISTSYVERSNLTIRMGNRRFTRLTNAFSKKVKNHVAMLAVQMFHYNFCRKHMSLAKMTPAQAAGIEENALTLEDAVAILDAHEAHQINMAFEAAFAEKYVGPRTAPVSYAPTPGGKLPWYLDMTKDGPPPDGSEYYND